MLMVMKILLKKFSEFSLSSVPFCSNTMNVSYFAISLWLTTFVFSDQRIKIFSQKKYFKLLTFISMSPHFCEGKESRVITKFSH